MPSTNCRACFEPWNVCRCLPRLDWGEQLLVELVRRFGGEAVWHWEHRDVCALPPRDLLAELFEDDDMWAMFG